MLIDTHVHLNDEQYDDDLNEVITHAREADANRMFVVSFNKSAIECTMKLIDKYDFLYGIIGWYPVDAIDFIEEHLGWIESLAQHSKMIGIGEIGLDYRWDKSPADVQKEVFKKQVALAKRLKLPIIIHNREAAQDCIDILLKEHAEEVGGIMHSFSDFPGVVDIVTNRLNFCISLGGPMTFENAKQPEEVAKHVSMERLLVETDTLYLSPHPYRGERNEPARATLVAEQIAELKGLSYEGVCEQITKNAKKLLNLDS